jgi:DNA-directed RNA polymerase I subunit RPA1
LLEVEAPPVLLTTEDDIAQARDLLNDYSSNATYNPTKNAAYIHLAIPLDSKKLLLMNIVEQALAKVNVKQTKGINKCHIFTRKVIGVDEVVIMTEGINFPAIWGLGGDRIDLNRVESNDCVKMLNTFGVEACRSTIIREIKAVFGAYFITVDYRHLALIADYMTFNGSYRPFNRTGIVENPSPVLKMSFETTMNFIIDAALQGKMEEAKSASASIVLGHPAKVGTGSFDIMQSLVKKGKTKS